MFDTLSSLNAMLCQTTGEGLPAEGLSAEALLQDAGLFSQGLLVAGVIIGLALFVMGRKIARPACAVGGLVIGGLGMAAVFELIGASQWLLFGMIGGAILFLVVAWALFRLWMALSCALILALLAPVVAIIIQGGEQNVRDAVSDVDRDAFRLDADELREGLGEDLTDWGRQRLPGGGDVGEAEQDTAAGDEAGAEAGDAAARREEIQAALWEKLQAVLEPMRAEAAGMWENLGSAGRSTILIAGGIGAVAGLLMGLIFPYGAAVLQTALIGTLLMMICALGLLYANAASYMERVDFTPRVFLLVLGLITVHGVGIQWTLFCRKTDKS